MSETDGDLWIRLVATAQERKHRVAGTVAMQFGDARVAGRKTSVEQVLAARVAVEVNKERMIRNVQVMLTTDILIRMCHVI